MLRVLQIESSLPFLRPRAVRGGVISAPVTNTVTQCCEVWGQSFAHRLGIRPPSQHSTCGICKKHKMLLERISNERARAGQMQEYVRHLKRTYADRVCYWTSPATSRLLFLPCGRRSFTMITDAMDKSKFKFPRSRVICSKEFQTFARPALDMSTIITHGHNCVIAVSGPHLKKDASWVVDLLSHAIHRLAGKYNVREAEFIVQSDNCGKETKNNVLLHFCGLMTALKKIYRIEMRFLQTAHTHEDVDQYFSAVATHIESCPELHLPRDFVDCLNQFGRDHPGVRPHESETIAFEVGQTRDWTLDLFLLELN